MIDLFCGAGGLSEGFAQAGYRTLLASDVDQMALTTFRFNHQGVPTFEGDIRELTRKRILDCAGVKSGGVDLIAGGPPCQGFSLAGQRLASDPRNQLFLEFARVVREMQPKYFVFENVPGITSMQGGAVLEAIIREFSKSGFKCVWSVLNAAEYGVPQARPRFFLIGSACSEALRFPNATHQVRHRTTESIAGLFDTLSLPTALTVEDALMDLPQVDQGEGAEEATHTLPPQNQYQADRRGARSPGTVYNHRATGHSAAITARYRSIPQGGDASDIPVELRTRKTNVFRLSLKEPSRTVTCNHRTDLLHPIIPRGTTVREAARLQSFDDDYRFFGNLTRKAKFVTQDDQVGNAVPPLLARRIAEAILAATTSRSPRSKSDARTCAAQ